MRVGEGAFHSGPLQCARQSMRGMRLPPQLLSALLLLAAHSWTAHHSSAEAAVLSEEERASAFLGWSESERHSGAQAGTDQDCPTDQQPEACQRWAAAGECLRDPSLMRAVCQASCRVVPRCSARGVTGHATAAAGPWKGHATAGGTAAWAASGASVQAAPGFFRQRAVRYSGVDSPPGSLTLSSLGIGTYLGGSDAATDEAVTSAVIKTVAEHRWNVIDSAANYRWGRAEVSVGRALEALRVLGGAEREQLFVSTKAGYPPEGLMERLLREGIIQKSDVSADGYHSMHPAYLRASLDRSLEALGLETVDLLYLHNPAESQLSELGMEGFMQRLRSAFEFCERARAAGQVKAYGVATWGCFRTPAGDTDHLSLQAVVELAQAVGGPDHGFRYIQLPVSAGMPEAWAQPWQELRSGGSVRRVSLMQAAVELGIGVFGSGPLMEAGLLKNASLAQAVGALPQLQGIEGTAPRLLQLARSTPGLLATLVGQKTPAHVEANCALTQVPPLSEADFRAAFGGLPSRVRF